MESKPIPVISVRQRKPKNFRPLVITRIQNLEIRKEASCTAEGYTGDIYCKDCGVKLQTGKTIAKKAHTWDAGVITTPATCTEKGVKTYTCTSCGGIKTNELPSTGHKQKEVRNKKAATWYAEWLHRGYLL